jgi:hypothetical protein
MDDLEVAKFWRKAAPGTLSLWCRCLIGSTTLATLVVAYLTWHLIWNLYGCDEHFYSFWVRNGVWLGIAAASIAAFAPRSRVSRFIRLATFLPLFHLVAVIASLVLWLYMYAHAAERDDLGEMMAMPIRTWSCVAIGSVVLVASAWLIQRREWLQAMLVLALSFLLLLGAWLPHCAAAWFQDRQHSLYTTLCAPEAFLQYALVPPAVAALAFTTLVMRAPMLARKWRAGTILAISFLLVIAVLSRGNRATVLYLNSVQFVVIAQGLAIVTLVLAGVAMWLGARRARVELRGAPSVRSRIADPDRDCEPVVELEIAGWLRAPKIFTHPFEVIGPHDRLPVDGARVLWSVPPGTTRLAIGERCPVLRRGDEVTIYRRDTATGDHPFRATRHVELLALAAPDAGTGLGNMMLMLWRPATAYMAIALAVMIPAALALAT